MIDFTVETSIDRAPGDVFVYVTDPAKLSSWQTNTVLVEQEGNEVLGRGTRLREVHRAPGGRRVPSVVEVTEFEPPSRFALHVVEGTPIDADIRFEGIETGTLMRFRVHGRLPTPMRLAEPLLGRALRRQFTRDCETLKGLLEQQEARPA